MAGVMWRNLVVPLTGTGVGNFGTDFPVPPGKAESLCLMVCLAAGQTADGWFNLWLGDPALTPTAVMLCTQEPVRYRVPGGSPVLLQDFILTAGEQLWMQCTLPTMNANAIVYNRWRYDV